MQDKDDWTALHMASRYSNTDSTENTVRMLIGAGSDVNIPNKIGWTALQLASRYSNTDSTEKTARMLIDAGANIFLPNKSGQTALNYLWENYGPETVEIFNIDMFSLNNDLQNEVLEKNKNNFYFLSQIHSFQVNKIQINNCIFWKNILEIEKIKSCFKNFIFIFLSENGNHIKFKPGSNFSQLLEAKYTKSFYQMEEENPKLLDFFGINTEEKYTEAIQNIF